MTLLGLGTMGLRHLRVLSGLADRFEITGAYDPRVDVEVMPGVRRLSSEAEAIAHGEVVVVATPIAAHAATVARALAASRHVLVEKPLCDTASQAEALAGAARGPARLFVGHSERFNPVIRALSKLVGAARGEPVLAIDLRRVGPSKATDCGVLVNLGVHDFDLAAYLGGGDLVLHAALGRGDELAHVLFATTQGAIGHLVLDRTVAEKRRSIALATPRWIYDGDLLAHRLVRTGRESGVCTEVPLPLEEPLVAQALALADALDGHPAREIATASDGARAVVLAERAAAYCASTAPIVQPSGLRGLPR